MPVQTCFAGFLCFGKSSERRRFLEAAEQGDDQAATASLSSNPDLVMSTTVLHKKTALHLAAEKGHVGIMAAILEWLLVSASGGEWDMQEGGVKPTPRLPGADAGSQVMSVINSKDADGRTPLITACGHGHSDCARLLLSNGAHREPVDARGNSALHYAAAKGHLGIMFLLLTEFQDELKAEQQYLGVQDESLPNVKRLVDARNSAGFAPLSYAVWSKQSGAVQVLLQHGADLITRNTRPGMENSIPCPSGSTPLHLAAMKGHIEISRLLLKTHYERVMEPMQLAAAAGESPESISRTLSEVDPRTQVNASGLVPYKVAQRAGYLALASLLRPHIPLARLFNEEEHRQRFYGPPALKLLAAEALNRKLIASLEKIMSVTGDPGSAGGGVPVLGAPPQCRPSSIGITTEVVDVTAQDAPTTTAVVSAPARALSRQVSGNPAASSGLAPVREDEERISAGNAASPSGRDGADRQQCTTASRVAMQSPFAAISLADGIADAPSEAPLPPLPPLPASQLPDSQDAAAVPWQRATGSSGSQIMLPSTLDRLASTGHEGSTGRNSASYNTVPGPRARRWASSASGTNPSPWSQQHAQLSPCASGASPAPAGSTLRTPSPAPGVVVLQHGNSITLTGAVVGGSTGNSMAQVMGLTELSVLVEDKPTHLRHRAGSCIPRFSTQQLMMSDEDNADVPWVPIVPEVTVPPPGRFSAEYPSVGGDSAVSPTVSRGVATISTTSHHNTTLPQSTPPLSPVAGSTALKAMRRTLDGLRKSLSGTHGSLPDITQIHPVDTSEGASSAAPGGGPAQPEEEEDENECGVCMEHPALVLVQPCSHAMCGPCAKKMLSLGVQRSPYCPFCRALISNFLPNTGICQDCQDCHS